MALDRRKLKGKNSICEKTQLGLMSDSATLSLNSLVSDMLE